MGNYTINKALCVNCSLCADVCVVYEKKDNEVISLNKNLCIDCGHCEAICPKNAITGPNKTEKISKEVVISSPSSEDILNLLKSRRSIRKYKKVVIKDEDINLMLEAGKTAPTGSNAQDVQYVIINNFDKIKELRDYMLPNIYKLFGMASKIASLPFAKYMLGEKQAHKLKNVYGPAMEIFKAKNSKGEDRLFYNAPALMIVHGEKQDEAAAFSSHIAMHNCVLMGQTLGIGCLLNSFALLAINNDKKLKEKLGIPKENKCFGVMSFGYKSIEYKNFAYRKPVNVNYIK